MKLLKVTAALVACAQSAMTTTHKHSELEEKEQRLSQSFASAFTMVPPKLMPKNPDAGKGACPVGEKIKMLTYKATGGAFLDGCYMNTTRGQDRNENTGEKA